MDPADVPPRATGCAPRTAPRAPWPPSKPFGDPGPPRFAPRKSGSTGPTARNRAPARPRLRNSPGLTSLSSGFIERKPRSIADHPGVESGRPGWARSWGSQGASRARSTGWPLRRPAPPIPVSRGLATEFTSARFGPETSDPTSGRCATRERVANPSNRAMSSPPRVGSTARRRLDWNQRDRSAGRARSPSKSQPPSDPTRCASIAHAPPKLGDPRQDGPLGSSATSPSPREPSRCARFRAAAREASGGQTVQ